MKIPHPHWWKNSGFGNRGRAVEQRCRLCGAYRHWTGKFKDYPGLEWAPGRAHWPNHPERNV